MGVIIVVLAVLLVRKYKQDSTVKPERVRESYSGDEETVPMIKNPVFRGEWDAG
jgi:hypothetical protein